MSLTFSPSDLSEWLACAHAAALKLRVKRGELARPEVDDPQGGLIRRKGEEHEARHLAQLREAGKIVAEIRFEHDWDAATRETAGAIRAGEADVMYQACLVDGDWRGFADFLERQPDGSYEAVDTKLARHPKPAHLFQLCFYSAVVGRIQGRQAERMHLVLGDGRRESFRVADYDAYYRRIRDRYVDFAAGSPETSPYPCDHCSICAWHERCSDEWRESDHLSLVANIRRTQVERLVAADITTMEQLAEAPPTAQVARIPDDTLAALREQAALQLHHRRTGEHKLAHLSPQERRGFALMPTPARGDVYYDIEGDPFYSPAGSLEYLHGVTYLDDENELCFRAFWALDEHEERRAFEELVDFLVARRRRFPAMHVYHYANYERSARELIEDSNAIGGIRLDESVAPYKAGRSLVYELTFPPQDFKVGHDAIDPFTDRDPGDILEIDEGGRIRLKRGRKKQAEPLPRALVGRGPYRTWEQQDAVMRVAAAFADGREEYRGAQDILVRAAPRARLGGTPVDAALSLDRSYLFVQGPPGSGKTYAGAEMALELMRRGRRVGVASLSHKAIHNFLDHVVRWAYRKGVEFSGWKKCGDWESTRYLGSDRIVNLPDRKEFPGCDVDLIAGTSYLFSYEGVIVDTLFVDEAGQIALADALAMATAATNVVLLGDPNQLPQVSQGAQPPEVRASVLEHLLRGHGETIPPGLGLFLERSWRLRPELCRFVSDAFYDGRLEPAEVCVRRSVSAENGLRFAEVAHAGNRQSAPEEAAWIADEVERLRDALFTDEDGVTRPLRYEDILVVAPYNAQVRCLRARLPGAVRVGTVDKFQGQEAPVVFFSMTSSSGADVPRGLEFLFSRNRFNVAVSRAQCLAYVVASPALLVADTKTPEQTRLVNTVCRFAEAAS